MTECRNDKCIKMIHILCTNDIEFDGNGSYCSQNCYNIVNKDREVESGEDYSKD